MSKHSIDNVNDKTLLNDVQGELGNGGGVEGGMWCVCGGYVWVWVCVCMCGGGVGWGGVGVGGVGAGGGGPVG